MPEAWYPGATRDPGAFAGYARGRNRMEVVKAHYTVGTHSAPQGEKGLFQWLVSRDGTVTQFAEADAPCWDSGEWNDNGPGIEVEYLESQDATIFTDPQRAACGALVDWLCSEWGVPHVYYDGPRLNDGDPYRGFISHRSLVQTEEHQDYWPQEDWDLMTGGFLMALTADQQYAMYLILANIADGTWENGRTNPTVLDKKLDDIRAHLGVAGATVDLAPVLAKLDALANKPAPVASGGLKPADVVAKILNSGLGNTLTRQKIANLFLV